MKSYLVLPKKVMESLEMPEGVNICWEGGLQTEERKKKGGDSQEGRTPGPAKGHWE